MYSRNLTLDPVLSRLLATAFSSTALLIVDDSSLIINIANTFISSNAPLLFIHFLGQLPLECQDNRVDLQTVLKCSSPRCLTMPNSTCSVCSLTALLLLRIFYP